MPLCDFSTTTIDFPKIMESVAVEQLQLEYRLGDIDRKEYVTRTNIEKDLEYLTCELRLDCFDGEEYYREFCSGLNYHIEESTSRTCGSCLCKYPSRRAVFRGCGHVSCLACAEELLLEQGFSARALAHRRKCAMLEDEDEESSDENEAKKLFWIRACINRKINQRDYINRDTIHMSKADQAHTSKTGGTKGQIHAAECKRLEIELDRPNVCEDLAMCAAEDMWIREKKELIARLREENKESDYTHRKCVNCSYHAPRINCAFIACGHVVCGQCALHTVHAAEAKAAEQEISGTEKYGENRKTLPLCPCCERQSAIVRLYETATIEKEE
ncbi:hypothetical protein PRIPAC_84406 [Pristionchus pacificus]|uniref:Uncharacterized protein n=1 Tax=Pristionchus pacificus TaxID=54126 RepID=A0A2A6BTY8_PRIPA|nr:hypothetical protein PRIPAC_84406 [Pristionchus pacificus]|eukprot:PDM69365.1 hypothetical protein PRIPAC_47667 [Pristionchus pacificus]